VRREREKRKRTEGKRQREMGYFPSEGGDPSITIHTHMTTSNKPQRK